MGYTLTIINTKVQALLHVREAATNAVPAASGKRDRSMPIESA